MRDCNNCANVMSRTCFCETNENWAPKQDTVVLLLAGHGDVNALGTYPRSKRSPEVPPGVYEGRQNRIIARRMADAFHQAGYVSQFINPGPVNQHKRNIIGYVNDNVNVARRNNMKAVLFEIHANSEQVEYFDERGWGDAHGHTTFISKRASDRSRQIANKFDYLLQNYGYGIKSRGVKEKDFTVITKVKCPAILYEGYFMSNMNDVKIATDPAQIDIVCRAAIASLTE